MGPKNWNIKTGKDQPYTLQYHLASFCGFFGHKTAISTQGKQGNGNLPKAREQSSDFSFVESS